MDEIKSKLAEISKAVVDVKNSLQIDVKKDELVELKEISLSKGFWDNPENAQEISKKIALLEKKLDQWEAIDVTLKEVADFVSMGDESLKAELETKLSKVEKLFNELKGDLKFSGPHDEGNAYVTIQSGAGGTDAQDWAEMLYKMYLKWASKNRFKLDILSESAGDEAGLKSVSLHVKGEKAYGKLKSENGVHRLVRLSPFNSANSRETSFAMVEVIPELSPVEEIDIKDDELKIDVYRAGGRGGQSVNTTDSAVRVTHIPTGITVAIQNERSQTQNKATAINVIRSKLAKLAEEQHIEKISELRGENVEAAWGNQIRSYVLHPYTLVKDNRSGVETPDVQKVLDGEIDEFIDGYLVSTIGQDKL